MKIFYQYGKHKTLPPTGGDLISEAQIVKALRQFAQVDYAPAKTKGYDLYYVRNNPQLFCKLPHPKIYFASPYHELSFKQAEGIGTYSEAWSKLLRDGTAVHTVPPNRAKDKFIFTLKQPIGDHFKPLQNHPRTKQIRKQFGGGFIIGHFGAMRLSRQPFSFLDILPRLKKKYPKLNVIFSDKTGINTPLIKQFKFSYKETPFAISACDLILYEPYNITGHYAGTLRTKEAICCGVPAVSPRFDARVEEFGENYELFHDFEPHINRRFPKHITQQMFNTICKAIESPELLKRIHNRFLKRRDIFSTTSCGKQMRPQLEKFLEKTK